MSCWGSTSTNMYSNLEFISWSVFRISEQGTLEREINDELINSRDAKQISQTVVNSAILTFIRSSAQNATWYTSDLYIIY